MAKSGRGGRRAGGGGGGILLSNIPVNAQPLTDADADQLRQLQDSMYDANTAAAVKMYISNTNFDGQGHSLSQTMNYLLDNDVDLQTATPGNLSFVYGVNLNDRQVASMQFTDSYMGIATHPIGKDVVLQRGAHDDLLQNVFGISDYSKLSQQQLQQRLVGQGFKTKSYMSTSYDVNKNPFLSKNSMQSGGREVVYNIKAGSATKMLFGAKSQSEIIIDKGTNFKITGVRYSGQTATPRGGRPKPQIIIDIETI